MDDYELKDNGWYKGAMMSLLPSISQHKWTCGWCNGWIVRESSTGPPLRSDHHKDCRYYLPPAIGEIVFDMGGDREAVVEVHGLGLTEQETKDVARRIYGLPVISVTTEEFVNKGLELRLASAYEKIKRLQAVVKAYCDFPSEEQGINLNASVRCDEMNYDLLCEVMGDAIAQLQDGDLEPPQ